MSGIAGFIHFDGRPAQPALLHKMTSAMHYRGPDGIRHWCSGAVALGHCALVSTAEQIGETQPLADATGDLVLVFDGRLDNGPELRRELHARGASLRDDSDAELVLRAYEQWNADCVQHLDGDFALVLWDARRASAFCARDRMGLRPLHYHWSGSTLAFASDVHAVLALPWVPQQLNAGMVAEAIAVEHLSREESFWEGVFRLPASTSAVVTKAGVRKRCYWEPDPAMRLPCRTDADYVHYQRELLVDVVKRQSRSHRPIACEVSGGLDSSAVFAVGHALRREGRLAAPDLAGFALSFSDALADESAYRRTLVDFVGAPIQEIAPGQYPVSWYQEYGATFRDFAGFPNWTMMRPLYAAAHSAGCRVVLNGTGGDEWLGSVRDWWTTALAAGRGAAILRSVRQVAASQGAAKAAWELLRWSTWEPLPDGFKDWVRACRGFPMPSAWLSGPMARTLRARRVLAPAARGTGTDQVRALQFALLREADGQFGRELAERQASMCGVERRQPFWSRRLVEAAFATPEWLRVRDGTEKWLHRRTMDGLLPQGILAREDKANFFVTGQQQRPALRGALEHVILRRADWVRPERMRSPSEYAGRAARADFAHWALLMADALDPRNGAWAPSSGE